MIYNNVQKQRHVWSCNIILENSITPELPFCISITYQPSNSTTYFPAPPNLKANYLGLKPEVANLQPYIVSLNFLLPHCKSLLLGFGINQKENRYIFSSEYFTQATLSYRQLLDLFTAWKNIYEHCLAHSNCTNE